MNLSKIEELLAISRIFLSRGGRRLVVLIRMGKGKSLSFSLIPQVFIKCLLYARHYSWFWR